MEHKIIIMLAFVLFAAGTAFGGSYPVTTDGTKPFTFKPSNNITVAYTVEAGTTPQKYAVVTKNKAGNRFYASANDQSNIYYIENATYIGLDATNTVATTAVGTGVLTSTGWTSQ